VVDRPEKSQESGVARHRREIEGGPSEPVRGVGSFEGDSPVSPDEAALERAAKDAERASAEGGDNA
jgi:hypothetical protein